MEAKKAKGRLYPSEREIELYRKRFVEGANLLGRIGYLQQVDFDKSKIVGTEPSLLEGYEFSKGEVFATIESVKAASEIYMPVSGKVVEVNEELINAPELVNEDVWGKGWLIKVESNSLQEDTLGLLEYEDYQEEVS